MPTNRATNLAPDRSVPDVLRDLRRRVRRDGGAVYYARNARTLRKVEAAILEDDDLVPHLTEHERGVQLVVTKAKRPFFWFN